MFQSAYETTPCRDYVVDKISAAIKKQIILHPAGFENVTAPVVDKPINGCRFLNPRVPEVPPFAHPMVVYYDNNEFAVYSDVRNFTRIDREQNVVVSSRLDYDLAVLRTWMQRIWLVHSPLDLLGLGHYPVMVYARWMTEAITKRLALQPDAQMRVSILMAYFYICMFYEKNSDTAHITRGSDDAFVFEQKELFKIATLIARATNVNAEEVLKVIDGVPVCANIQDLCKLLVEQGGSIRFQDFNPSLVYGIVSGSWFGQNHRELVAVAVEHPVTWMAILAKAVNERGFHNTIIGKVAKLADRGDLAKNYVQNILNLPID
jgi:hypothetical protein